MAGSHVNENTLFLSIFYLFLHSKVVDWIGGFGGCACNRSILNKNYQEDDGMLLLGLP